MRPHRSRHATIRPEQVVGPLLFDKKAKFGMWCNYTHHGQCGFVGVYQPELPAASTGFGSFVLIGQFRVPKCQNLSDLARNFTKFH